MHFGVKTIREKSPTRQHGNTAFFMKLKVGHEPSTLPPLKMLAFFKCTPPKIAQTHTESERNNTKQSKTSMPLDTLSDNHILNVKLIHLNTAVS